MAAAYELPDSGALLRTELDVLDGRNTACLLLDGDPAAEASCGPVGQVVLVAGDRTVRVAWLGLGRVVRCALVTDAARGVDGRAADRHGPLRRHRELVPFAPPPGTRAARLHAWQQRHPRVWAARHVVWQTTVAVATVLGVSALISALLGRLLPRITMPDISPPDWLPRLDPFGWLVRWVASWWPDWSLGWHVPDQVRLLVPILVAVGVAVREVRRRQQRERENGRAGEVDGRPSRVPDGDADDEDRGPHRRP